MSVKLQVISGEHQIKILSERALCESWQKAMLSFKKAVPFSQCPCTRSLKRAH